MTNLLYNKSSYIKTFTASVLSCEPIDDTGDTYAVTLDRTAFFPEQGGQYADRGTLGGADVLDVQIKNGDVVHTVSAPLAVGAVVEGVLDWETRYDRMQNHTGEHIVSGILHAMFGYDNVGFHLGDEVMTLDTSGELTAEQIAEVERRANRAVYENKPVLVTYPDAEALSGMEYRAKLDLMEDVRIVTIPDWDVCACCAPHVAHTGEVGMIKMIDAIRWKGGMRLTLVCGSRALADYCMRKNELSRISTALSAKAEETYDAFCRVQNTVAEQKAEIVRLRGSLLELQLSSVEVTDGNLCLFLDDADNDALRAAVNACVDKCGGLCGVFTGSDADGYRFVIGAKNIPLRARAKEITAALDGRGGGSDQMISGSVKASAAEIRAYFAGEDKE